MRGHDPWTSFLPIALEHEANARESGMLMQHLEKLCTNGRQCTERKEVQKYIQGKRENGTTQK